MQNVRIHTFAGKNKFEEQDREQQVCEADGKVEDKTQ
jgi:hypothetical protein